VVGGRGAVAFFSRWLMRAFNNLNCGPINLSHKGETICADPYSNFIFRGRRARSAPMPYICESGGIPQTSISLLRCIKSLKGVGQLLANYPPYHANSSGLWKENQILDES